MARWVTTVGHSTHGQAELVDLLHAAGVEGIADVRRFPGSRRHPHFAREALARWLAEAGIVYEHLGELGGRRERVAGSPNGGWEVAAFQAYADHMAGEEFARGLARLEELAVARRTAVMCAEGPWWRCHRRLVADALLVRGWTVCHLMPDGRAAEHELPPFAVVRGVAITYPPLQRELPVG